MKIDPLVYHAKFPKCCILEECRSRCCKGGVWADIGEKEVILKNAELFVPYMRPEAKDPSTWFGETTEDPDCPSGIAVETNVAGDYCVFFHRTTAAPSRRRRPTWAGTSGSSSRGSASCSRWWSRKAC
jgi:hypothetical protein